MDRPHIIDEAEFEFTFRSTRQAIELPIELGRCVMTSLLPIVEEVFDSVSGQDDVLRIDTLEIDLGTVRVEELERRFAERLRARMQQVAREQADHRRHRDRSPDRRITTAESDFEVLRYFLEHGHLPWNAAIRDREGFEQLVRRVVRSNRENVLQLLTSARDAELVLDRVSAQFPEDAAVELLEAAADARGAGDLDEDAIAAEAAYEEVREYLFENRTGTADALLAAIERITRQYPSQALRLLRELQHGAVLSLHVAQTYGATTRQRVVAALRSALLSRDLADHVLLDDTLVRAGWPLDERGEEQARDEPSYADVVMRLVAWVTGTAPWPDEPRVTRMLARRPEQLLSDVLRVLRPADYEAWLRGAARVGHRARTLTTPHLRLVKWAFLLGAARTDAPPATEQEVADRFERVLAERPADAHERDVDGDHGSARVEEDVLAAYALYDEVRGYLVEGRAGSESALLAAIEKLTGQHPWLGVRLVREWQSGVALAPRIASIYHAATRKRVVAALQSVLPQDVTHSTIADDAIAAAGWRSEEASNAAVADLIAWATGGTSWPGDEHAAQTIARLPEPLLAEVVRQLRPADHRAWLRGVERVATTTYGTGLALAAGQLRRAKWDFLLRTAGGDTAPVSDRDVAQRFAQVIAGQQGAAPIADVTLLDDAARAHEDVVAAYALYEEVRRYLVEGRAGSDEALLTALDTLTREHPWQARRLLREFQSGMALSARVAETYGMATRQRVVAALQAVLPPPAARSTIADRAFATAGWPDEEAGDAEAVGELVAWATAASPWPGDEHVAQTIARLPESLLAGVVRRLRPADHRAWLRGVERVATAVLATGLAIAGEQLRRTKWTFLLRTARTEAAEVHQRDIAHRFIQVLAAQQGSTLTVDVPLDDAATPVDEDMVAAYALFDEVRAYLVEGRLGSDEAMLAAIERLTRQHPWQGVRLLRELQGGTALSPRVAETYGPATRQRVVAALQAALSEPVHSSAVADDAIAGAGWPREELARPETASALVAWATGAAEWPGDEHVSQLIARLPEALLAYVVRRLRPVDHREWLRGVERVATATYRTRPQLAFEVLRRAKWDFLLQTARTGPAAPATEQDIAQRFATVLATHHGVALATGNLVDDETAVDGDLLAAYAVYDEVRAYLVGGRMASDERLLAAIDTLTREHVWQGLRLVRELQSGEVLSPHVPRSHTAATRQRVIAAFQRVLPTEPAPETRADQALAAAGWPREAPARVEAATELIAWATGAAPWPTDEHLANTIARVPEALLADVVRRLRPADHRAWLRGVERMATAGYRTGAALAPEHLRRTKWVFLLRTTHPDAAAVTERDVAQAFATLLATQHGFTFDADIPLDDDTMPVDEDILAAYALYDEARAYLVDGRSGSDEALVAVIGTLTHEHRWQGLRLLRELQGGVALSPEVAHTYGALTRQRVVAAFRSVLPNEPAHDTTADDTVAMAGWPREAPSRGQAAADLVAWATGATPWPGDEHLAWAIARVPDALLADVVRQVRPHDHGSWLRGVERVATASYATSLSLAPEPLRRLKWRFLLKAAQAGGPRMSERAVARRFAGIVAEHADAATRDEVRTALVRQFERDLRANPSMTSMRTQGPRRGPEEPRRRGRSVEHDREPSIHVDNAGIVIASPYLPRLFAMLNLVDGPTFKDEAAARRAVHLLQFMVDSRTDAPEHMLVLNKILCGVPIAQPIERRIDASDDERAGIEGLIRGMIQNWSKIGRTSVAGFRESFLQRGGTLHLRGDEWLLEVEPRAFDMLLDYIPWSFSIIKHPWMPHVVHVEWR
jgi:hypothetical protein